MEEIAKRPATRNAFLSTAMALFGSASVAQAQSQATSLRIGVPVTDDITPALYAKASGMFASAGYDVTIEKGASGTAIAAGVIGGTYQFGNSGTSPLIAAHAKGVPLVFVAPGGVYNSSAPNTALLVAASSTVRSAADLSGKTVACSAIGDLYTLSTRNWVDRHGGDSSTLKFVEIPASALPAALESGRIDAGGLQEPALSVALASKGARVLAYMHDAIAPRFLITAWFTSLDFARKNQATVNAFRRVLRNAAVYANAHHAETIATLADFTLMDPKVIAQGTRSTYGISLDPSLIQPLIELCAKYKAIAASFPARDVIDPSLK